MIPPVVLADDSDLRALNIAPAIVTPEPEPVIETPSPRALLAIQDPRLHAEALTAHFLAMAEALEAALIVDEDATDATGWFLPHADSSLAWATLREFLDAWSFEDDADLSLLSQDSTVLDQEATTTLLDLAEQGHEAEFKDLARMLRGDVTDDEVNALWRGTRRRQGHKEADGASLGTLPPGNPHRPLRASGGRRPAAPDGDAPPDRDPRAG